MNQHIHRIVFNRRRGQLMAVAETAATAGKAASGERRGAGTACRSGSAFSRSALAARAALGVLLGLLAATADPALAQIVANPNAPGSRQATVLNAGNGVPLVNIQTPNAAGVSMNSYSQFDVQANGAILNNSRTNAQTQLGGWVQGNPWLATGPASVIVNQVQSSKPSLLNGYVEVAGQRASVVVANPSGISVGGGGFINASGVTLTTGTPQFGGNGTLAGYSVQGGQISVGGQGLDLSGTDYAQLLARAVAVNAGIWANNLKVVTGINNISADGSGVAASGATPQGPAPAFAIDVAQLGGMYAGKIFLVGTETGLGVRNAGTLAANAGPLTLSADGKLTNTGTVSASGAGQDLALAVQGMANSGTISSQHDIALTDSGAASSNSGRIDAASQFIASTNVLANQAGGVIAAQGLQIAAQTLQNAGTLEQTGAQALTVQTASLANSGTGAVIGAAPPSAGGAGSGFSGTAGASAPSTAPSTAAGGSSTTSTSAPAEVLPTGQITAAQGIQNSGQLLANGATDVTTSQSLVNAGTLNVRSLSASGSLDNSQGQLQVQSFTGAQTSFINRAGRFFSQADLSLAAQSLDNSGGQIGTAGSLAAIVQLGIANAQGQIASGGGLNLVAGAVDNSGGQLLAAGTLRATAPGAITNSGGSMLGDAGVTLQSGSLANDLGGAIGSGAGAVAIATGALGNQGGNIAASGAATILANGIANQGGSISGATLAVQSQGGAGHWAVLNNLGGTLLAANALTLDSAGLDNTQGTIATAQAGSTLDIRTYGGSIVNGQSGSNGGILSAGTASIDAQGGQIVNSNGGTIGAVGNLSLAGATIANQGGAIASNANAQLTSSATNGAGIDNSAGGRIQAQGNLALNAASSGIANDAGSLAVNQDLTIASGGALTNTNGAVSAGRSLSVTDAQVAVGAALAAATQDVINTGGTLQAGQSLNVQSRSLTGDGSVQSGGDMTVALGNSFTETAGGTLSANGRLNLTSLGDITNQGNIAGGSAVSVAAANVDNQAGAAITSAGTTAVAAASMLTNRGLIDGSDTQINAGGVNNIGTGRIYGDHLSIQAGTVNNQAETVNGTTTSATIAARGTLDIAAQTLNNSGGSTVLSLGDMRLAGALDANRNATQGQMAAINNGGSTIEAGGKLLLAAAAINNTNSNLQVRNMPVSTSTQPDMYQLPGGQPSPQSNFAWELQDRSINTVGGPAQVLIGFSGGPELVLPAHPDRYAIQYPPAYIPSGQSCTGGMDQVCTPTSVQLEPRDSPRFAQFGVNPPPQVAVIQPDPTTYGASAMTTVNPIDGTVSTTYYWPPGANQAGYNAALAAYNADQAAYTGAAQALNNAIAAANAENRRTLGYSVGENYTAITGITQQVTQDQVVQSSPGRITSGGDMTIAGNLNNIDSSVIAGGTIQVIGSVNNQATQGTRTTTTSGTAQQYHITYHSGGMFGSASYSDDPQGAPVVFTSQVNQTFALGTLVYLQNANPSTVGAGGSVGANGNTGQNVGAIGSPAAGLSQTPRTALQYPATSASGQPLTVRTLSSGPALPTSSLYTLNPANPNAPLVETDPAFTNQGQWLGSDYLLSQLGVDPATVQQRLGDGFYEQQLLAQQVAQLTGRSFLGDYTREDEEYRALMDAGATFARSHGLRPGVALSAGQIAQLTSDIVWLVPENVTLPGGATRQVLVPKLYVLAQPGDLAPSGALISGNNIDIHGADTVTNSGTIAARNVVQITADAINDIGGRIAGNQVGLAAVRDINVIGGSVEAAKTLVATAGGDINVASTTRTVQGGSDANGYSSTVLDRVGSLAVTGTATDPADPSSGVLQINAGRDVNLKGASVSNAAVGGQTSISATRDLNLATVTTSSQLNIDLGEGRHLNQGSTSETGTQINAAGDLNLQAGRDLTARAASVQAGGNLSAAAGRDLTITNGQATGSLDDAYHHHESGLLGSSSGAVSDSVQTGKALGSSFAGNTVAMNAGHDLALTGSIVAAQNGASLLTGNNLAIAPAADTRSETHSASNSDSGWGLAGYQRSSGNGNGTLNTSTHVGSTLASQSGNILVAANMSGATPDQTDKGVVAISGSTVSANSGQVGILANQVFIGAAADTLHTTSDQTRQSTSWNDMNVAAGKRSTASGSQDSQTLAGSSIQGSSGVSIAAAGYLGVQASNLDAGSGTLSLKGGVVDLQGGLNTDQRHQETSDSKSGINSLQDIVAPVPGHAYHGHDDNTTDTARTSLGPVTLNGKSIAIASTAGDTTLAGVQVKNQNTQVVIASKGNINLNVIQTSEQSDSSGKGGDAGWQSMHDKGRSDTSTHYNQLGSNVSFNVAGSITAQMSVKDSAAQLAKQPGMGWIGQLQSDPTLAAKVNWTQVQEVHDQWDYKAQGLTPAAAAVVTVVVAYFTAGAGSSVATSAGMTTTAGATGASTIAAAGAGVAGSGVAAGTVLTTGGAVLAGTSGAAITTLTQRAAVSFINNGGDIGKTLQDLGSNESIRSLVANMLTATVSAGYAGTYNMGEWSAKVAVGCASGAITGAGCQQGAQVAAVTAGAGWAYHDLVGYAASSMPGKNPEPGTNDQYPFYEWDKKTGQQNPLSWGNNVVGFNGPGSVCSQGSTCSLILNEIPFINATAGFHDWLFNSQTVASMNGFTNVATMLPAAAFSIPAALDNWNFGWIMNAWIPKVKIKK